VGARSRGVGHDTRLSLGASSSRARARGNEINAAKRKIGFAPVDLLYYESLSKSTKKYMDLERISEANCFCVGRVRKSCLF